MAPGMEVTDSWNELPIDSVKQLVVSFEENSIVSLVHKRDGCLDGRYYPSIRYTLYIHKVRYEHERQNIRNTP